MNSDQSAGFFDNDPGGSVGYRKNSIIGSDPVVADIFLEPISDFLGQEGYLGLFSALGISNDSLPVFDIFGCDFENLADPHARAGHEFENEAIPGIGRSEDDLINDVFFNNLKLDWLPCPEKLSEGRIIAWFPEFRIDRVMDEIVKMLDTF
jgi:hypothetical protein